VRWLNRWASLPAACGQVGPLAKEKARAGAG
jgi:hypothetical protein